jgi:hypothetical protein
MDTPSKAWKKSVGKKDIDLGGENPLMDLFVTNNLHK